MRFSLFVAALAPVLSVYADNIMITVGASGALAFNPSNITAKAGDVISFQFQSKNHSVTQSTFPSPCTPIQNSPVTPLDSGFQAVASGATQFPQYSFTMSDNVTAPLWFYCAQTTPANHCNAGMVFSVNANETSAKSFAAFQAAAKTATSGTGGSTATNTTGGSGATNTTGGGAAQTSQKGAGVRVGTSAASLLAIAGVVAGLFL